MVAINRKTIIDFETLLLGNRQNYLVTTSSYLTDVLGSELNFINFIHLSA